MTHRAGSVTTQRIAFVLRGAERIGSLSSTPSTMDISSRLYQAPATHLLPSNEPPPNSSLTQQEWSYETFMCAKQSSTGISSRNQGRFKHIINHNIYICTTLANNKSSLQQKQRAHLDVRDHSVILDDWMMSNPTTQRGFVTVLSLSITKA